MGGGASNGVRPPAPALPPIAFESLLPTSSYQSVPTGDDFAYASPGNSTGAGALVRSPDSSRISAISGELSWTETDLHLPGIGLDFVLARTYRSGLGRYQSIYGAG